MGQNQDIVVVCWLLLAGPILAASTSIGTWRAFGCWTTCSAGVQVDVVTYGLLPLTLQLDAEGVIRHRLGGERFGPSGDFLTLLIHGKLFTRQRRRQGDGGANFEGSEAGRVRG